jgi:hypothetical protein
MVQFRLRTLFIAITLAGLFSAYQLRWIQKRHQALVDGIAVPHYFAAGERIPKAPLGIRVLGEKGMRWLLVSPSQFARVCKLFPEAEVIEYPDGGRWRASSRDLSGETAGKRSPAKPPVAPVDPLAVK